MASNQVALTTFHDSRNVDVTTNDEVRTKRNIGVQYNEDAVQE